MRRLLMTLFIFLVILLAALAALVVLVNPNDFCNYMINKVKQKNGYQLELEGDLRWHAWPQLSILAGRMKLTAPGAALPLVSAENMRLDVLLWPLLFHQLSIKQVMLKGAVITITSESAARHLDNTFITPLKSFELVENIAWSWNISSLQVVDSLLILQQDANEQLNLRNFKLKIEQNNCNQARIYFSSHINRDQRDLSVSLNGSVDLRDYPRNLIAQLDKFTYRLQGGGLPEQGIQGEGLGIADYSQTLQMLQLKNLMFSANDNHLSGQIKIKLGKNPVYLFDFNAANLNLDTLTGFSTNVVYTNKKGKSFTAGKPVIATFPERDFGLDSLKNFSGQFNIFVDQLIYHGLMIRNFKMQVDNRNGYLTLNTLTGKIKEGDLSISGILNTTEKQPTFILKPVLKRIALGPLLKAFALSQTLNGLFSIEGQFQRSIFTKTDYSYDNWHGHAIITLDNVCFEGLNIQQFIQRVIIGSNNNVDRKKYTKNYSQLRKLTTNALLHHDRLQLINLKGSSDLLGLTGNAEFNFSSRVCDVNLNIRVLNGWKGDAALMNLLTAIDIPLRIYGPWSGLRYQLNVDQLLRKRIQDELKRRMEEWRCKNQQSQEVKNLLDKL